MQYYVNGKVFDDVKEAEKYEQELKEKEYAKQKKEEDRKRRLKEIEDIEKEYVEKLNKFYEDYGYFDIDLSALNQNLFYKLFKF